MSLKKFSMLTAILENHCQIDWGATGSVLVFLTALLRAAVTGIVTLVGPVNWAGFGETGCDDRTPVGGWDLITVG